ncbi:hypothetical protein [Caulobacter sp. 17J65-9]|uniref:hypothetical protein n=1 Tax=Caulobacter sp. 17J65-9 TaxID=2709382 RepID=UPI0013C8AA44|nr:hypothetical protein [Caulobacter sp. 17J65-9]NEX92632.1 hypothetical protein [Caulobacter sp. 17J65-9]
MFGFLRTRKRKLFDAEVDQIVSYLIVRHGGDALAEAMLKVEEHTARQSRRAKLYREVEKRLRRRKG